MVCRTYGIQRKVKQPKENLLDVGTAEPRRVEVTAKEQNQSHMGREKIVDKLTFLGDTFQVARSKFLPQKEGIRVPGRLAVMQ